MTRRFASAKRLRRTGAAVLLFGVLGAGCPRGGSRAPQPIAAGWGLGAGVLGEGPVRGVAAVADGVIVTSGGSVRRVGSGGAVAWSVELGVPGSGPIDASGAGGAGAIAGGAGGGGAIAGGAITAGPVGAIAGSVGLDGDVVAIAVAGTGEVVAGGGSLHGEPGAAIVGVGAEDGTRRWVVGAGSSRWTVVRTVVGAGDGFLIAGSFAGTLRVGARTVTSAGNSDGFVASLDRAGGVRWLRRMGGDGADLVAGVAALGAGRVAVAGTFTGPAELGDATLIALGKEVVTADGFVAVVEADGAVAWSRTWGGLQEDTCAGLAVLGGGALAIAGTVRGEVDVSGRRLDVRGPADGLVAVFAADAAVKGAWLVGGDDFDGVTAIGGAGDRVAVAGWFTGTLPGPGGTSETSDGVDDVFVVTGDASAAGALHGVRSAGPASVTGFAVTADGWRLAVHAAEAATSGGDTRPAGAALWFRGW